MIDGELEKAHFNYIKRKNEICTKLDCIYSNSYVKAYKLGDTERKWLKQAIDFIKEGEI